MEPRDWGDVTLQAVGMRIVAAATTDRDMNNDPSETLFLLFNAHPRAILFHLPPLNNAANFRWEAVLDTSVPNSVEPRMHGGGKMIRVPDRTLVLYRLAADAQRPRQRWRTDRRLMRTRQSQAAASTGADRSTSSGMRAKSWRNRSA
jgi:hypothetical protein